MLNVHVMRVSEYPEWTVVGSSHEGIRIDMCQTERTCLVKFEDPFSINRKSDDPRYPDWTVENLGFCRLDKGHDGDHASIVWHCDGCGKTYSEDRDEYPGASDEDVSICETCCDEFRKGML